MSNITVLFVVSLVKAIFDQEISILVLPIETGLQDYRTKSGRMTKVLYLTSFWVSQFNKLATGEFLPWKLGARLCKSLDKKAILFQGVKVNNGQDTKVVYTFFVPVRKDSKTKAKETTVRSQIENLLPMLENLKEIVRRGGKVYISDFTEVGLGEGQMQKILSETLNSPSQGVLDFGEEVAPSSGLPTSWVILSKGKEKSLPRVISLPDLKTLGKVDEDEFVRLHRNSEFLNPFEYGGVFNGLAHTPEQAVFLYETLMLKGMQGLIELVKQFNPEVESMSDGEIFSDKQTKYLNQYRIYMLNLVRGGYFKGKTLIITNLSYNHAQVIVQLEEIWEKKNSKK
jgi:hypothetical protein